MTDAADADAAAGVGEELARARAARGLSIAEVAQLMKFAPRQIEALEEERFADLPAGTFARGMVRSYARVLKLDPEPLVRMMAARVTPPANTATVASVRRPIPITDNARRTNLIYAALSLAILGVIAAVVFEWQSERSNAGRMTFVPAARAPLETQRSAVAPPNLSPLAAADPLPAPSAATTPVVPQVARAAASAEGTAGTKRIVMKFERISWVEIKDRAGKTLLSQLNPAGSEQTIDGRPPFALIVGNAQYVRLSYEDRQIDLAPHVKVEVARFTLE